MVALLREFYGLSQSHRSLLIHQLQLIQLRELFGHKKISLSLKQIHSFITPSSSTTLALVAPCRFLNGGPASACVCLRSVSFCFH